MKKGLTLIETLLVLSIIPIILSILIGYLRVKDYFAETRDVQRLKDILSLNSAINFYFQNASNLDPDGPNLDLRGVDEIYPTIFVSIPGEKGLLFNSCYYSTYNKVYFIYQSTLNDYQKIDGSGWIPIKFLEVNYPNISNLPVDPINNNEFYYTYAFQRTPASYEIAIKLESSKYRKNGSVDKTSIDGGDDENRLEMGNNLKLIPPLP